jgi:ribose transport system permease protein
MNIFKSNTRMSRFVGNYGMLGVLGLICLYYSVRTYEPQHPGGKAAARILAKQIALSPGESAKVIIAIRQTEEDALFADTLKQLLEKDKIEAVGTITGAPVDIRNALNELIAGGRQINVLATIYGNKNVLENIKATTPALAEAIIAVAESKKFPTFLRRDNLRNISNQIAVIAIVAVGMTMIIITGGIDLSVGSLVAFSAVVAAWMIGWMGGVDASGAAMTGCCIVAIILCGLVGTFSGAMVTKFRIPPFIVTLAVMQMARGLAFLISQGQPIHQIPDSFTWLGRDAEPFFSIPYAVILMVIIYLAAHVVMSHIALGRYIYAVGGNSEAARLSGVRVNRIIVLVYALTGLLAGLGGIVMASQLKSGAPTFGNMYELYIIAAAVVGGASLKGGEGKIFGTLIGAFIIAVINNGMNLTNVESYKQKVVLGAVILGAVLLDTLKKRK